MSKTSCFLKKYRLILLWCILGIAYILFWTHRISKAFASVSSTSDSTVHLFERGNTLNDSNDQILLTCNDIKNITPANQCRFAKAYCKGEASGFFDYVEFYFCTINSLRFPVLSIIVGWLIFLFITIGISASDFFSTNLVTISWLLQLPDSVVGVTFLALGNGSPDILSTFAAVRVNSGGMAIGELLGSAFFIVAIVAGSVCLIKPFKIPRRHFLRDVAFLTGTILLVIMFVLHDGSLSIWQSLVMILYYLLYVLFVFFFGSSGVSVVITDENYLPVSLPVYSPVLNSFDDSDSYSSTDSELSEEAFLLPAQASRKTQKIHYINDNDPSNSYSSYQHSHVHDFIHKNNTHSNRVLSQSSGPIVRPSLLAALDFRSSNEEQHPGLRSLDPLNIQDGDLTMHPMHIRHSQSDFYPSGINTPVSGINYPNLGFSANNSVQSLVSEIFRHPTHTDEDFPLPSPSLSSLLFPTLRNFAKKSWYEKLMDVLAVPSVLIFTLALPVYQCPRLAVDPIYHMDVSNCNPSKPTWSRKLRLLQCVFVPFAFVTFSITGGNRLYIYAASSVFSILCITALYYYTDEEKPPKFLPWVSFIGFVLGIIWISTIANEVVGILRALGVIFNLNESILGLTVFAAGNSLSDLIADIMIARSGFPEMAMGGVFGGPTLNILIGIGISSFYSSISNHGNDSVIEIPHSLSITAYFLLACLLLLLIYVPLNRFRVNRVLGLLLFILYIVGTSTNIVVELLKDK
ncbi:putative cation exchanger C3A12.06c [Schizosaccharomyces pombe]